MKKIMCFVFVFAFMLMFIPCLSANDEIYSLEKVEKGIMYSENIDFVTGEKEICINDIYSEKNFYIGVGYTTKQEIISDYYGYPYIVYYENDILLFTKVIETYGYGEFKKVIYFEECFYIIGDCETNGVIKPILLKIDNKGNIHKMICLYCDQSTTVIDFYIKSGEIFLFLNSYANNINDYELDKANNKFCLINLNLNLQISWLDCYGNDGTNSVYNIKYYNDYFYIYSKVSGKGDFQLNKKEQLLIFGINIQGDIAFSYYMQNVTPGYGDFFVSDNEPIFYNYRYYDGKVEIYSVVDSDIKKEKDLDYTLPDKNGIVKERFFIEVEKEIFVVTHYTVEENNYLFFKGEENNYLLTLSESSDIGNINILNLKYKNGFIYIKCQERQDDKYIFTYKKLICVKKVGEKIYFNNNEVNGNIDNDLNPTFGKYYGVVSYFYDDIVLYIDGYVVVPLKTQIVNKGIYDIGLKLEANGQLYLNNTLVEQGYIVTKEGEYLLEIQGENEDRYLMFSIKKLSSSEETMPVESVECSSVELKEQKNEQNVSYSQNHSMIENKTVNLFLIIGMVLAFGFLIGFVIPLFIYRRKMNG